MNIGDSIGIKWITAIAIADLRAAFARTVLDLLVTASVLVLVFVLWGLRSGVVNGYATAQLNTPEGKHVLVSPRGPIRARDIAYLRSMPEVGFVAAGIGNLNERIEMVADPTSSGRMATVVASGDGDPYLEVDNIDLDKFSVAIGDDLQSALNLRIGDTVNLKIKFRETEPDEFLRLTVAGVVRSSGWIERAAFVDRDLAAALSIKSYAEPGRIDLQGIGNRFGVTDQDEFDTIRIYAKTLEDVPKLVKIINSLGWRSESREALIEERIALENATSIVFIFIVLFSSAVILTTFVLSIANRVIRLKKPVSVLISHGMSFNDVVSFLIAQNALLSLSAWILATAMAIIVSLLMNNMMGSWVEQLNVSSNVCRLSVTSIASVGAIVFIFSVIVSKISAHFLVFDNKLSDS